MTTPDRHLDEEELRGFAAVRHTLDASGVRYEINITADYHAPPFRVVKTVALWANGQLCVVALPGSQRLDIGRVRHRLGDEAARPATAAELSVELPGLDAGALPPFGAPAPPLALVDRGVLSCNWVLANGGDLTHSLRLSPLELVRLSHAHVVDIAEA
jgi:prolyl-tRNA editing enzyme YbaK/EbsC (Cys-tRNA(Pro) deacylase)